MDIEKRDALERKITERIPAAVAAAVYSETWIVFFETEVAALRYAWAMRKKATQCKYSKNLNFWMVELPREYF